MYYIVVLKGELEETVYLLVCCIDILIVVGGEMIYLLGESAEFICEYGYTLQTNSTLVCLSNSTWSDNIPQCELITCNTSLADDIHVILPNISLPSVGKHLVHSTIV